MRWPEIIDRVLPSAVVIACAASACTAFTRVGWRAMLLRPHRLRFSLTRRQDIEIEIERFENAIEAVNEVRHNLVMVLLKC